jgi:hypothetical protein
LLEKTPPSSWLLRATSVWMKRKCLYFVLVIQSHWHYWIHSYLSLLIMCEYFFR